MDMLERITTSISVVSLCSLIVMINVTTPTNVGPFGILVFFGLMYLTLLGLVAYFIFVINKMVVHLSTAFTIRKPLYLMSYKKALYFSSIVSATPVIILGIQTVGAVDLYETILIALFTVIGCIYVAKRAE
jgi:hypothetical protein